MHPAGEPARDENGTLKERESERPIARESEASRAIARALGGDAREAVSALESAETLLRESEQRLEVILDTLTEGVIVVDEWGNHVRWNRAGLLMHGFLDADEVPATHEALGEICEFKTLTGESLPLTEWPVPRVLRGDEVSDLILRFRRRDGTWERVFSFGGSTVTTPRGERLAVLSITDVTERQRADERFRVVVEMSPVGMVVCDRQGTITLVNTEAERLLGWPRHEILHSPVERLIPAPMRREHVTMRGWYHAAPERRAMGAGRALVAARKDGSTCPVEIGLMPIELHDEPSTLAVITDISARLDAERERGLHAAELARSNRELERINRELAHSNRELARSNRELAQFAYVASHDLQEPLRMVVSFTELFMQRHASQVDERGLHYLQYVTGGARRMQQLVRDLLSLARVGSQGRPLERVDTSRALVAVLQDLGPALESTGGNVQATPLPDVWADPVQLHQLLLNVIGNAVKFRGSAPPEIEVWATREGARWRVSIRDNGIGIAPEHRERVFGMFQRLHTREEYDGSGIGLAIARRIMERHGGEIWFDSTPGEGTTFHCTFLAGDAPLPEELAAPRTAPAQGEER